MLILALIAASLIAAVLAIYIPSKLIACIAARITKFLKSERS